MNKLPQPGIDDVDALERLSVNRQVGSYPHLQPVVQAIVAGYNQYRAAQGDAHHIANIVLPEAVKEYLKGHYAKPPADLAHITALRQDDEERICPMCGSMHRGTLDHLLPKQAYAAFAVFSLNLIPACKCNVRRKETTIGVEPGERVLHPYFDNCLAERLISARFEDLGRVPRVSIRVLAEPAHPQYQAITFHVREVVHKTAVLQYLVRRWGKFRRKPQLVIRALGTTPHSVEHLRTILAEDLELTDELHEGKNNWNSIFTRGLLDDDVVQWLFERLTMPGRGPGGALA